MSGPIVMSGLDQYPRNDAEASGAASSCHPAEFLAAAERGRLIHSLGTWVLTEACRQLVDWSMSRPDAVHEVAVNVSPRQLLDPRFTDTVVKTLDDTGLGPGRLTLEITETSALELDLVRDQLRSLQLIGVGLAIDDFGTGFSSMSRLATLPVKTLKIDRSFVAAIPTARDAPMVRAVIGMAHSLGLTVIAEGIETEHQRDYLTQLGCQQGQGYLFGRPMPADELAALTAGTTPSAPATGSVPRQPSLQPTHLSTGNR